MSSDDLHEAARRRREREAARTAKHDASAAKNAAEQPARERRVRRGQVQEALAEAGWQGKLLTVSALCIGLLGPMAIGIVCFGGDSIATIAAITLASLVGAVGGMLLAERLLAAIRRWRLFRIGRGFQPALYLDALGEKRRQGVLVVRARFDRPWPEADRDSTRDAVMEWMPSLAGVEWDGATLVLKSAQLDGTEWLSGGPHSTGTRVFNNRLYHGCLVGIVDAVLPRLEKVAPIVALSAEIRGSVEAWDADADD